MNRHGSPTRYRKLLCMCELPPSTAAGAPIILKQLLSRYGQEQLEVLCDARHYPSNDTVRQSLLPCRHSMVRNVQFADPRPRTVFQPLWATFNALRVSRITAVGRRIVESRGIEAILTVPWRCEFALAALRVVKATGVPLYVFEMDDWEAMNPRLLPGRLVRRYHKPLLEQAKQLWLVSPAMVREYESRFGVRGVFLHHHVDLERYRTASARPRPHCATEVRLVYTGAINDMFYDTMLTVCEQINLGMEINGRTVKLRIYSAACPPELLGPHVTWQGFVASELVPDVLAEADTLLVCISFSSEPRIVDLVRTSLYTKTIGYLAAGRPVLVIGPSYAAELEYFGEAATAVTSPERSLIEAAIAETVAPSQAVKERVATGLDLVAQRHSTAALDRDFLSHFRTTAVSD